MTTRKKEKVNTETLEMLKKACPKEFGALPAPEINPRFVSFQAPPECFRFIRKWLDLHLPLQVITSSKSCGFEIFILNVDAVRDYNLGRDPKQGYSKKWKQ
ncbi:MAG: hypothetical protein ABSA75_10270 [Candidatus Bathyarchaeia archaeon]|jgi:hypothetical protein